jgi:hypothetical protein
LRERPRRRSNMAAMAARNLSSLKGLEKFQMAVVEDGMPAMERLLRSKKARLLMDEIHKEIFELGPPTPPNKPTGRSRYQQWLMHHASEISRSLDTMRDIEFYIGKFPYRKTQIAKHRHLQFHVEAFLHELYILQERLVQFLKFIERQHRRDPRLQQIKDACAVLNTLVIDSMRKGVAIRASHVHRWRMSDAKIDRLNAISFYTMMPNKKIKRAFRAFYESEYRKTRKQWRSWITGGISEAQKLVDAYFDAVYMLVFDGKSKLAYPSRLKF